MQPPVHHPARMRLEALPAMSVCPFCGVVTETPHENQQGCVTALGEEITRLRRVLEQSEPAGVPGPDDPSPDPDPDSEPEA